jgi:gamma-glutamyltranspeptidase/glutathione hydrolase
VSLAPYSTRYAAEAIVCTVDNLAAQAGVEMLRSGGCAVDAAIAAGAVLAVTQQHQCGLGGDLLALVHCPGNESPSALYAGGRAGSGADPQRLRAAGYEHMPAGRDRGCAPVPGCVDGWVALHERFGRLPLEVLLAPARSHAGSGFSASQAVADAARLLSGVAYAGDFTAGGPLVAGQIVRRPGVARALEAIARAGRRGFYEGEFGEALLESGDGEYSAADLVRVQADWVKPLGIDAFGQRLWSLPPGSQGYLLLRSAAIASGLELPEPEHPDWAHLLIESSREAAADRDATWHEASDGQTLIAQEVIAAMRARITSRAGAGAPGAVPGGTVSLCVVDRDRMAVSMLQSNFASWGSLRFVAGVRVALHNRGSCFSLQPGHPAEYGPGRRPPHTLAPALLTNSHGSLEATLATRGGHIQPQILLQLLARLYAGSETPAQAMAAGRWAHSSDGVLLEGQAPANWSDGLCARGHRVQRRPPFQDEFGHAQVIVSDGDHLAAASDPRSPTWAVGAL